ncbi:MAG: hypothetical protein GX614_14600 [Sandaracinaceae bacterium]|nr:hypothetical protein [Sandaracinaceae bacterium]
MSKARPVFAGDVVHIQRRTRRGYYFLIPRPRVIELVRYCYAVAAKKYGLRLHAICVMSTHVHVIATDTEGRHPDFTAYAHRLIALGLKRLYGIEGTVWKEGGVPVQRLIGHAAITDALGYVRVNPVAAGMVRDEARYPGVLGADESAPLTSYKAEVCRPSCFGAKSHLPLTEELELGPPECLLDELGCDAAASAIAEAILRRREEAQREHRKRRRAYLGIRKVLRANIWTRAGELARAERKPTFKGVIAKAIRSAHETLRRFREAYALARARFRSGETDVQFPPGTYYMRWRVGCRIAGTRS